MPFTAPKPTFQGHQPPQPPTAPYSISTTRQYVIATAVLPASAAITMKSGDTVTATLQQTGTGPNGPYPRVVAHTYKFQRDGQAGDALGATISNMTAFPKNIDLVFRLATTNPAGQTVGIATAVLVRFV